MTRCQKSPRIAVCVAVIVMLMSAAHHRDEAKRDAAPPAQTTQATGNHFDFDLSLPGIRAHLSTAKLR